jgi:hypothetical protein
MTLNKTCTCGAVLTTKGVKRLGLQDWPTKTQLLGNCRDCGSTAVLAKRVKRLCLLPIRDVKERVS